MKAKSDTLPDGCGTTHICIMQEPTCESRLKECDELVEVADRAIQQQQRLIGLQADQISDLKFNYDIVKNQLSEVERDRNSWYRNPVLIVPLSFVLGAYVYSQATK